MFDRGHEVVFSVGTHTFGGRCWVGGQFFASSCRRIFLDSYIFIFGIL